jgi:hypothetical protein
MEILNFEKFCLLEDGDGGGDAGFSGYGSTEGMGNPSTPTSDSYGSGDVFNGMGTYHNTSGHSLSYVKNYLKKERKKRKSATPKKTRAKQLKGFSEFLETSSDLQQK